MLTFVAWLVHLFTSLGGALGMASLYYIHKGDFHLALYCYVVAYFIDGIDGTFARWLRVEERIPSFSGARLDDAVDVLLYIYSPVCFIWRMNVVHPFVLACPVLAGLFAYGQKEMKTSDNFFLGFPSYWNVLALYIYWLDIGALLSASLIVVFSILSFIPTRYLYPSRSPVFQKSSLILGGVWATIVIFLLFQENPDRTMILTSLFYPIFYLGASFYTEWRMEWKGGAPMKS